MIGHSYKQGGRILLAPGFPPCLRQKKFPYGKSLTDFILYYSIFSNEERGQKPRPKFRNLEATLKLLTHVHVYLSIV